jgi:cellulase/cellobiase CelA1
VKDTLGRPLVGAKVTLYRSNTATGTFTVVPNGSTIMSDKNRKNPDATGLYGDFSWDVLAGFYKVRASYPGCHAVGNPSQPYVDTIVYQIPPPALGIKMVLQCPTPAGGTTPGVTVKLTDNGDQRWQRYCKNVVVTNTNNYPVEWKVKFDLPYPGNIDPAPSGHWNFNFTAAGNTITAWGVDWNKTLAAKATSNSIGFCAFKK